MEIIKAIGVRHLRERDRRLIKSLTDPGTSPKRGYYVIYSERIGGDWVVSGAWYGDSLSAAAAACKKAERSRKSRNAVIVSLNPS